MSGAVKQKVIRIGCGHGFWGDSLEAPYELVTQGPLDYLVLDFLAEVTMSILARQRRKNGEAGYALDFIDIVERVLPEAVARGVKIVTNAGGMNPLSCAKAVKSVAERLGLASKVKLGVVEGDDLLDRLPGRTPASDTGAGSLAAETLANMDDGRPIESVQGLVQSANAYIGAAPVVEALRGGATVVVTGRVADPSLVLAPLIYEHGWADNDWDRLAAGTVAGHLIECGAQCTGGNCSLDWETIPEMERIGYPIVEVSADGDFVVTKHSGTGGRVDLAAVKEQLVYEIGDPARYVTPDVVADFTSLHLEQLGAHRVRVSGVKGGPCPERLKVSISYSVGYSAASTLVYSWPKAIAKARRAGEVLRKRLEQLKLPIEVNTSVLGFDACHGALSREAELDLPEAVLRIAVRGLDRAAVKRFTREVAPLVLNGPPTATGYFGARGEVQEVFAFWPTTVARSCVAPSVSFC